MAIWSWSPQSQRSEPSTSPVKHDECIRTRGGRVRRLQIAPHEGQRFLVLVGDAVAD